MCRAQLPSTKRFLFPDGRVFEMDVIEELTAEYFPDEPDPFGVQAAPPTTMPLTLPRDGKHERAFRDAELFLSNLQSRGLLVNELQIGQVEDSFFFEWAHTYVNIPFELNEKGTRFYVHHIPPGRREASEFLEFGELESALVMTEYYVTKIYK